MKALLLSTVPAALLLAGTMAAQGPAVQTAGVATDLASRPFGASWVDLSPPWLSQSAPLAIAIQPGDPDRILLGTAHRGVVWTANGGVSWNNAYLDFYINDYTPSWWVTDIAFNPALPSEVIATTLAGTYWSDDTGQTWFPFTSGDPGAALAVASSPDGTKAMVAGFFGSLWTYDWNTRVWAPPVTVLANTLLMDLSFDAENPAWAWIGTAGSPSLWTTPDGSTLNKLGNNLPAPVSALACDPTIPGRAHAASGPLLYLQTNGPTGGPASPWVSTGNGLPGTDIMCLAYNPADPERMYMGLIDHGVYHSPNRGLDWMSMGTRGMTHLRTLDVVASEDGRYLYACGHSGSEWEGGFYRLRIGR